MKFIKEYYNLERLIKTRIIQKHAEPETWESSNFIPKNGEVIIYDYENGRRIKVGDGSTPVSELSFADSQVQFITWEADD
jgi:hypothetical protein